MKNKTKIKLLSISLLCLITLGMLYSTVYASTTYQSTLVKGTDEFIVNLYNDTAWKTIVDPASTPSDWFEGDANVIKATSKVTIKGWNTNLWQIYNLLTSIFMPLYFNFTEIVTLLGIMESQGYNETTINANYTTNYNLWYGISAVWNFTDDVYEEEPSYTAGILVLQDPSKFETMLDDYNTLAADLNSNPVISGFPYFYNFPILTTDEFLWQLILNGLAIAKPQSEYLTDLISGFGCDNASSSGSTLIFERYGLTNYTVEVTYGSKGTISTFTVKDIGGTTIYKLISTNSDWVFYTILIITSGCVVGLGIFLFLRKRKLKR